MIKFNLLESLNEYKDDLKIDDDDELGEDLLLEQILNCPISQDDRLWYNTLGYIQRITPATVKSSLKLLDGLVHSLLQSTDDKLGLEVLAYLISAYLIKLSKITSLNKQDFATWCNVLSSTYTTIYNLLNNSAALKLWGNSVEKDTFVSCFTKPIWQLLENEQYTKNSDLKAVFFNVLSISIVSHGQLFTAQSSIIQNLEYFDHLAEPMAELLSHLYHNFNDTNLTHKCLVDVSHRTFTGNDLKAPRTFSKFIIKLTQQSPALVLKHVVLLQSHIDSDAYTMRNAIIECFGLLIAHLTTVSQTNTEDDSEATQTQIQSFFTVLMDRYLDNNSYVRSKVISTFLKIVELPTKFPKQRIELLETTIRHLSDKSSTVRKNATALIIKLILTHPYGMLHGGRLNEKEWQERLDVVEKELSSIAPKLDEAVEKQGGNDGDDDDAMEEDDNDDNQDRRQSKKFARKSQIAATNLAQHDADQISRLQLTQSYYADALNFIHLIEKSIPTVATLLSSTNKPEVLEAIEFFRVAHEYGLSSAQVGVRRMIHLIWSKDNAVIEDGKEVKGVRARVIDTYKSLYLDPINDPNMTPQAQVSRICKNLIQLTFNATLAELTSLEALVSTIMAHDGIHQDVINKLWQVYSVQKDIPRAQRRGAIIIIGMLAVSKSEIVHERIDTLIRIGLGQLGKSDLALARYTCIALQRISGSVKKVKGSLQDASIRLPMSEPIFRRLQEALEHPTTSRAWFGMAEQAINAIYVLGEQPDILCNVMIKHMARKAFTADSQEKQDELRKEGNEADADADANANADAGGEGMDVDREGRDADQDQDQDQDQDPEVNPSQTSQNNTPPQHSQHSSGNAFLLSQLVFTVGHVAIRHIVYLELVERELKRRKADADAEKDSKKNSKQRKSEGIDEVAGNAEDDIGDGIAMVKERELLYGSSSLLATFGPILSHICYNPRQYSFPMLRSAATLSLSKFMCVSSKFCEEHLLLLFKILETTKDATIRCNIVIALGDIAVCFSNLIDENSDKLYAGLSDDEIVVKKNTFMVLTHLILNGMVKVKGQLGEMAKCLDDTESRISDLAKLFFTELSTKDNAVYNNLPDIISHLSVGVHAVDEEVFKSTMKFIFKFIEKEKQAENIIDKLCQRFRLAVDEKQWRDVAFCLSLLPFKSERSIKKLMEGLPYYADKLHEPTVFKRFMEILSKSRTNKACKNDAEMKEFEDTLNKARAQGEEEARLAGRAAGDKRYDRRKSARLSMHISSNSLKSDDEEEGDKENEDADAEARQSSKPPSKQSKQSKQAKNKKTVQRTKTLDFTSDEDDNGNGNDDDEDEDANDKSESEAEVPKAKGKGKAAPKSRAKSVRGGAKKGATTRAQPARRTRRQIDFSDSE
ncbi:hypothetical protein E3P99_02731 [Wallemia hederae]|uniref:Condensin complex subunit 1 n=1 Tax=Wallemia hederae TaxID=1540922 RepID=A0A4T0FJH6_9BASI|nr:hypothetical protein E3P99_02731 [Wallemia hederae]